MCMFACAQVWKLVNKGTIEADSSVTVISQQGTSNPCGWADIRSVVSRSCLGMREKLTECDDPRSVLHFHITGVGCSNKAINPICTQCCQQALVKYAPFRIVHPVSMGLGLACQINCSPQYGL